MQNQFQRKGGKVSKSGKIKENWQLMCGKDNKVCEAEPWRMQDFNLKNRAQQNTEIYKVFSSLFPYIIRIFFLTCSFLQRYLHPGQDQRPFQPGWMWQKKLQRSEKPSEFSIWISKEVIITMDGKNNYMIHMRKRIITTHIMERFIFFSEHISLFP